ncbi:MAG: hypothetical protein WB763_23790 [Terriglobia bacterium]|jgi:hypothetical protein
MNIWSQKKKRDEKLNYMHNNPVKRGLVKHPGDLPLWRWGSCLLDGRSILGVDKMLRGPCHPGGRIHPDKTRRDVCATRGAAPRLPVHSSAIAERFCETESRRVAGGGTQMYITVA